MNIESATDGELINRFATEEDQAAYEELVRRHGTMVFRLCRRITACVHDSEDAVQKVFTILAERAASLTGHQSLAGWLYSTAWHVASHERRTAARRRRRELAAVGPRTSSAVCELEQDEFHYELYRAMEMLPPEYRTAIVLHHLQGMRIVELAAMTNEPVGTIAARLSRGRAMIRERMAWRGQPLSALCLGEFLENDLRLVDSADQAEVVGRVFAPAKHAYAGAPLSAGQFSAELAGAGVAASSASAPAGTFGPVGFLLSVLQGRAALYTTGLVLLSGASAPAAWRWANAERYPGGNPNAAAPAKEAKAEEPKRGLGLSWGGGGSGARTVPEPGTAAIVGIGVAGFAMRR